MSRRRCNSPTGENRTFFLVSFHTLVRVAPNKTYLWQHHTIRRLGKKRKSGPSGPSAPWEMGGLGHMPNCYPNSCGPSADFGEPPNCTA